jgi:hypothetical protein
MVDGHALKLRFAFWHNASVHNAQLFNLSADISEAHNLAQLPEHRETVSTLFERLMALYAQAVPPYVPWAPWQGALHGRVFGEGCSPLTHAALLGARELTACCSVACCICRGQLLMLQLLRVMGRASRGRHDVGAVAARPAGARADRRWPLRGTFPQMHCTTVLWPLNCEQD